MNNLYISPEFEVIRVEIKAEVLLSSVEQPSTYVDPDPGDWGDLDDVGGINGIENSW